MSYDPETYELFSKQDRRTNLMEKNVAFKEKKIAKSTPFRDVKVAAI
jgi:hypothetical protein